MDLLKKVYGLNWLLSCCTQVGFSRSLPPKEPIKCLTLNNRPCQAKLTLVHINSDETLFYPITVSVN